MHTIASSRPERVVRAEGRDPFQKYGVLEPSVPDRRPHNRNLVVACSADVRDDEQGENR